MKEQLLVLVEWAKYIPAFCELPLDDQVREDAVCGQCGPWVGGSCCTPPRHPGYGLGLIRFISQTRVELMCAWSCLNHFTNISSFNPSDNPR